MRFCVLGAGCRRDCAGSWQKQAAEAAGFQTARSQLRPAQLRIEATKIRKNRTRDASPSPLSMQRRAEKAVLRTARGAPWCTTIPQNEPLRRAPASHWLATRSARSAHMTFSLQQTELNVADIDDTCACAFATSQGISALQCQNALVVNIGCSCTQHSSSQHHGAKSRQDTCEKGGQEGHI